MFFSGLRKLLIFLISANRRSTAVSPEIYIWYKHPFQTAFCAWKLSSHKYFGQSRMTKSENEEVLAGRWPGAVVCVMRISGCSKLAPTTTLVDRPTQLICISDIYLLSWRWQPLWSGGTLYQWSLWPKKSKLGPIFFSFFLWTFPFAQ